jgi:cytochrome b subunit of formate dehydrogenase
MLVDRFLPTCGVFRRDGLRKRLPHEQTDVGGRAVRVRSDYTGRRPTSAPPASYQLLEGVDLLLWLLVLLLIVLAVAGGIVVTKLLWLILIAALIVAVFAAMAGRSAL